MDRELYGEVKRLYLELRDLPPDEVSSRLDAVGSGAEVRDAVLGMLGQAQRGGDFLAEDTMREAPLPERIGRYRILEGIGRGGMGTVYAAEQDSPRRPVALKLIHPALLSPDLLRRFELETELQGRLHHPGIARIYDAGVAEIAGVRQPYLAMERVQGRPLDAVAPSLSPRDRIALVIEIADAVEHAHQQGIIHRDLKPANILVDEENRPVILDFGIARAVDLQKTMATRTGELVGTLPYMSPEQVSGDSRAVDTRTDVYALGVILYQLLTGRLPIEPGKEDLLETVRRIRDERPPRLSTVDRRYAGDLDVITRVALEKDKERRYGSAHELADDLKRFLGYQPIGARPPSTIYEIGKLVRRHRLATAALALAVLGLIGGITIALREVVKKDDALRRESEAREEESRESARAKRGFDAMRKLVREGLFDVYYEIDDKPGTQKACEMLLDTANQYLAVIEQESEPTPALLRELSRGYAERADALLRFRGSDPEQVKRAIRSMSRSLAYLDDLAPTGDLNPRDLVNYSRGLHFLGEAHKTQGEHAAALAALKKAEAYSRRAEAGGGRYRYAGLRTRLEAVVLAAAVLMDSKDNAKASEKLDEGRRLLDDLSRVGEEVGVDAQKTDDAAMRTLLRLARFESRARRYDRAATLYQDAHTRALRLFEARPTSTSRAENLLGPARLFSWHARRTGRATEAIQLLTATRRSVAPLFDSGQDLPRLDFQMAHFLKEQGEAQEGLGRPAAAREAWEALEKLCEKRLDRDPEDRRFRRLLDSAVSAVEKLSSR